MAREDEDKQASEDSDISHIQQMIVLARRDNAGAEMPSGPPIWLISFTDVVALMLTFFVLLYAMSNPEPEKWEKKIGITTQNTAQFSGARNQAGNDEGVNLSRLSYAEAENLDYLQALFAEIELDENGNRIFSIVRNNGYLLIVFNKNHINGRQFNGDFISFINRLTPLLKSLDNRLTLLSKSSMNDGFRTMQKFGNYLREKGYRRPFVIQQADGIIGMDGLFAISVQPHDGRRINR